jgi:hypothetical protein
MTRIRDKSNPIARWRATIEALEAVVLSAANEAEINPAEAEEVRHLIMIRIAARRRSSLPAAWPGPRIVMPPKPLAELNGPTPDRPLLARPPWRE